MLYRPHRRPDVQQIMESSRQRSNVALAATTFAGVRKLIRALRQGQAVGMLPDQVPAVGEGVALDLGGHHAYTMTLPAALHASTGAPVVLAVGLRKPFWGFELRLFAGPADLSPDITQATRQINEAMVKLIKQYPNQYYWAYERFRPPRGVQTWEELFEKEPLKPAAPQGGCRSAPESFQGESSE
ncbi:MAG: hypothetical protein HC848_09145 [Limnobacter sp.]|nr:hypothetical protein [Limnobacter sp.]